MPSENTSVSTTSSTVLICSFYPQTSAARPSLLARPPPTMSAEKHDIRSCCPTDADCRSPTAHRPPPPLAPPWPPARRRPRIRPLPAAHPPPPLASRYTQSRRGGRLHGRCCRRLRPASSP